LKITVNDEVKLTNFPEGVAPEEIFENEELKQESNPSLI
jgi:hypothetical protein